MIVFSIAALSVCYAGAAISRAVIVHVTTTATACEASAVTFMGIQIDLTVFIFHHYDPFSGIDRIQHPFDQCCLSAAQQAADQINLHHADHYSFHELFSAPAGAGAETEELEKDSQKIRNQTVPHSWAAGTSEQ